MIPRFDENPLSNNTGDSNGKRHLLLITGSVHIYAHSGTGTCTGRGGGTERGGREGGEGNRVDGMGRERGRERKREEGRRGKERREGAREKEMVERGKGGKDRRESGGRKVGKTLKNMNPAKAFALSDSMKI